MQISGSAAAAAAAAMPTIARTGAIFDPATVDKMIAVFNNPQSRNGSLRDISDEQLRALSDAMGPFIEEVNAVHQNGGYLPAVHCSTLTGSRLTTRSECSTH